MRPDDVGRWTTRKPIDAAPRLRFKSTRTLPQRATPTTFDTIGRLRLPPTPGCNAGATLIRLPLSPQSDGEAVLGPQTIGGGPGRHCQQLDSDTGDALAHLALDLHAAHSPGRATEAGRRLNAGDPGAVQAVLCGSKPSDCRGVGALTPRAHSPLAGVRLDSD